MHGGPSRAQVSGGAQGSAVGDTTQEPNPHYRQDHSKAQPSLQGKEHSPPCKARPKQKSMSDTNQRALRKEGKSQR
eukprot:718287-Pelagomonas_calceolata.AAC.5